MNRSHLLIVLMYLLVGKAALSQPNVLPKSGGSKSFTTPGTYKFVVPKGVKTLTVSLTGPGGWGGGTSGNLQGRGGSGGIVTGDITVKEGEELTILVGTGGGLRKVATITAITRVKEYLAIAGCGGNGSAHGGRGGSAGPVGIAGSAGSGQFQSGNSGMGATAAAGGAGGNAGSSGIKGTNGIALAGGTNNAKATGEGWGGAGWFGGGASGTYGSMFLSDDPYASGGGGGGTNYTKGLTGAIVNGSNGGVGGVGSNWGMNGKVDVSWK